MRDQKNKFNMGKIIHENVQNTEDFPFRIFDFHAHNLNRVIPFHWHQSTEILFCGKGQLTIKLQDHEFTLNKDDFVVINPYQIHATTSPKENWILCIQLPYPLLAKLTSNSFYNYYLFEANSCDPDFNDNLKVKKLLRQILELQIDDKTLVNHLKIITKVIEVITSLTEDYAATVKYQQQSKNIQFIENTTNFLNQNYAKNISLRDIANHFSYSESYTSRLIKASLGTNFSELLRIIRINKAIDLFNSTNLSLTEIAERTGFQTYRNLYNAFHKTYRLSPKEFLND